MDQKNQNADLPRDIWILGFVSLLTDISSEIIHGLLPIFLTTVLGASFTWMGIIDGVGEAVALIFKFIAGPLSDRFGKRKIFVLSGYGMAMLSKPLFALANSPGFVFGARVSDRIGKGVRDAPRDALIADIVHSDHRGRAFGLRQSLDNIGAFVGPMLGIVFMSVFAGNFRLVFWVAVVPAIFAVLLIFFGLKDPKRVTEKAQKLSLKNAFEFKFVFWSLLLISGMAQFSKLSEAFLILRAKELNLPITYSPVVLIVMNIIYAITAYPVGRWADKLPRKWFIGIGFLILIFSNFILSISETLPMFFLATSLWGLHLGFTQGVFSALVADYSPAHLRGTGFGLFNLVNAIAILVANPLAGFLWDKFGSQTTFSVSTFSALLGFFIFIFQFRSLNFPKKNF